MFLKQKYKILIFSIFIALLHTVTAQQIVYIKDLVNYRKKFKDIIDTTKMDSLWILINKEAHIAHLIQGVGIIKSYPITMSSNFINDKKKTGDCGVPEGIYYLTSKPYKNSVPTTFYKFCGLSYPNKEDAEEGFKNATINRRQYDLIISAHKNKVQYIPHTPLGSAIGIHGDPDHSDTTTSVGIYNEALDAFVIYNWTLGCIAFNNYDFDDFIEFIEIWKTPIYIRKTISSDSIKNYKTEVFR